MTARPTKKRPKTSYHHGDLRAALLAAGETVLRRDGVSALGMRTVTREAGVSHTAAKPHFGSLEGLRGEIAAIGYQRLAEALEATHDVRPPRARRIATARAYVRFAHENSALFELMFRYGMLDMTQRALVEATARAVHALAGPLGDPKASETGALGREVAIRMAAGWAFVHGLAVLLIEKRLRGVQKRAPAFGSLLELADAVVDSVSLRIEP
jgi:AcrR family transcriptional regulator